MSDEFLADNFGVYAPGLRVTKLGPDGEQLFSVEQGKITFHKSGVYEISTPATVRWLPEPPDYGTLLSDLFDPEPCRLDHNGDCQEHNWFNSDRSCPMERVRHLPGLAASAGMSVDQGAHRHDVLRVRPHARQTFQLISNDGDGEAVHLDSRTVTLPTDTRTQVAGPDGPYPAVWVTQRSGHDVQVRLDRSAGQHGPVVEVWAYQDSDVRPPGHGGCVPEDIARAMQANSEKLVRELGKAQGDLRIEREISAELRTRLDTALGNLAQINTTANGRRSLLNAVGKVMHEQANRVTQAARSIGDGADFYVLCDVAVQLRQAAINQCGVPYDEPAETHDPNADVPWGLRQWALLARQAMEQQAEQVDFLDALLSSMPGMTVERPPRRIAVHAVKTLREVVAEYPEDLDAIQAEQATRNADDEAVRRLAHAMTEVANQLDSPALGVIPNVRLDSEKLIHLVRKLRGTVEAWTTEEQRRPWAQATSGGQHAAAEPVNEEARADHPTWWVAHAGCRHSVDSHRTQRDGAGCRATDCDCQSSTDGLRRQRDLVESEAPEGPRGDEGATWGPDVVFRDVLKALHLAEWLTHHLRGSVPSDYIGPNNELNRSVRRLLGLAD